MRLDVPVVASLAGLFEGICPPQRGANTQKRQTLLSPAIVLVFLLPNDPHPPLAPVYTGNLQPSRLLKAVPLFGFTQGLL